MNKILSISFLLLVTQLNIGCFDSNKDSSTNSNNGTVSSSSMTLKDRFSNVWNKLYSQDVDPATISYEQFLTDIASKLRTDASFLAASKGLKGDKGEKGDTGLPGSNGATGLQGNQGIPGQNGVFNLQDIPNNSLGGQQLADRNHSILISPQVISPASTATAESSGINLTPVSPYTSLLYSFQLPEDLIAAQSISIELLYQSYDAQVISINGTEPCFAFDIKNGSQGCFSHISLYERTLIASNISGEFKTTNLKTFTAYPGGIYSFRLVISKPVVIYGFRVSFKTSH
jgi:hypothetical protein